MVHLISYELKGYRPQREYERIAEEIKAISGVWCHIPESKWLVETNLSTQQAAARLAPLTVVGDTIFVTRIYNDWHSYSLSEEQLNWLHGRNFRSPLEAINVLAGLMPLPVPKVASTFGRLIGR